MINKKSLIIKKGQILIKSKFFLIKSKNSNFSIKFFEIEFFYN